MSAVEIVPTVVPQSAADVAALLSRCRSFARSFHLDAADGSLAPNATWIPRPGEMLPEADSFLYEAHLMLKNPEAAGLAFARSGARRLIAHVEGFEAPEEAERVFAKWKAAGAREVGVAVLVETPLDALEAYTYFCDGVTLMTIASIGAQGAAFDPRGAGRVYDLHARYPGLLLEADGAVGPETIPALSRSGASRFAVGSALSQSADPALTCRELETIAESAIQ